MYKQNLELDNLQGLICHKTQRICHCRLQGIMKRLGISQKFANIERYFSTNKTMKVKITTILKRSIYPLAFLRVHYWVIS